MTRIWARRGTRPRAPRDTRYKWSYIFGAACPARGMAAGLILPRVDAEAMSLHLQEIAKTVATGAHVLLIMDGAGWHQAKSLDVPENITLLKLPAYAPRAIALQSPSMSVRRKSLLQPAFFNFTRFEPFAVFALMMPNAIRRSAAKLAGALSFRARYWSSFITTSRDQCKLFSISQCPRISVAAAWAVTHFDRRYSRSELLALWPAERLDTT